MGSGCSSERDVEQSRAIDRDLKREAIEQQSRMKLLLLGAGECGKSTILKQVRILHCDDESFHVDRDSKKGHIYSNIIQGMDKLCDGIEKLKMHHSKMTEHHASLIKSIISANEETTPFSFETMTILKELWNDQKIQAVYAARSQLQIADSIAYFLDRIEEIQKKGYTPSNDDYLQLRVPTTGVVEQHIRIRETSFAFIDVGGQRSERKKWIFQFDGVNAVIFLSAISEYDQNLFEMQSENRLKESIKLFYSIANSKFLTKSAMILFLNKTDLFREKVKKTPITKLFKDYRGPQTYEASVDYIRKEFEKQVLDKNKREGLYVHETCATDTTQVQFVIDAVVDAIIRANLKAVGAMMD